MQPKTKLQKEIVKLSKQLPALTKDQIEYAKEKLFKHEATLLKSGRLTCLDCGHKWQNKDKSELGNKLLGTTCPNCKRHLSVLQTRKKNFSDQVYFQVITTFKGYQLIRMFKVGKRFKAGEPQYFYHYKLYENWISEDGKIENVGMYITSKWNECWGGDYEIRGKNCSSYYDISLKNKYVYPEKKFIPILKRNGLKTSFHKANPYWLFRALINNPKAETLLKAKQYSLLRNVDSQKIYMYWSSIKICLRNNYRVKDSSMWFDYLELLRYFHKDLHNAKYVCPADLNTEHDRYMNKKRKIQKAEDLKRKREKALKEEAKYFNRKGKYIGLKFSDGNINIHFLESVKAIMEDADALHHCAFTNNYQNKDTLLFSAIIDKKKIATIEICPDKLKVLQVRGLQNGITKYDKQIREILEKNMKEIQKRRSPRKTRKLQLAS